MLFMQEIQIAIFGNPAVPAFNVESVALRWKISSIAISNSFRVYSVELSPIDISNSYL